MSIFIYKIELIETGECYVGSTKQKNIRFSVHRNKLKKHIHHSSKLQEAWTKTNNELSFIFSIVEKCLPENRYEREQWWINNSNSVLNGTRSAYSPSCDPKVAAKISKAEMGKPVLLLRKPKPPFTQEHKNNISKSQKGIPKSPRTKEHIENWIKSRKGKPTKSPPIITCPHCKKIGGGGAMYQWHFDNCKTISVL